jgi:hypothetical protein|nr:MAG: Protein of unknown function (DUF3199) [Bacteriophage sp.]
MKTVDKSLVTDIVKVKLGVDTPSEPLLKTTVDEIEQTILNYCNINEIPKELTYTFANMVVDLFRYEDEFIKATTVSVEGEEEEAEPDVNTGNINSIRVGDTTITFGSGSDTSIYNKNLRSHQANLDTVVLDYESQLKKFRRLVW